MKILKFAFQTFTLLVDISGIVISLLSQDSFENANVKLIIHFCQAFRTELILLLIALFCIFYFIPYIYKHYRQADAYNKVICICAIAATIVFCLPIGIRYAKARYYYFNNNILETHAQFGALEKGVKYLKIGEYNLALDELNLAKDFSNSSRFDDIIDTYKKEIQTNIETSEYIYENYVISNPDIEDKLHKLEICAKLNPTKFEYSYTTLASSIKEAIDNYPKLYHSVHISDFKLSQELIRTYGDVWFEPIVKERLLHTNEKFVMNLLHEYLENEDCSKAQSRMTDKF